MTRIAYRLGCTALALVAAQTVLVAQTATTGAVQGIVTDAAGNPITGASVRFTSAQISRTLLTGSDGRFKMGLMNAGTWQFTVTKSGYTTINQNVTLSINETRAIALKMAKETEAVVQVIGAASNVDATSTTTGLNISSESLSVLPLGRSVNDYVFLSPGVVSGGTTFGSQGPGLGVSINGASGAENTWVVDGLVTNDFRYGGTATNLSPEFIESVDIQTGGYKPEFSALGGVFSVVTKSGSNEFSGSAWTNFEPIGIQAVNKKSRYFNQEGLFVAPPVRDPTVVGDSAARLRMEYGATVGGALVKDKFFYFAGLNMITSKAPSYANFSGVTNGERSSDDTSVTLKLNYFFNTDNQLTFSYFGNRTKDDAPNNHPALYGDADYSFTHKINSDNFSLVYDWTIKNNLLLSVKGGVAKIGDKVDLGRPDLSQVQDYHWFQGGGGGIGDEIQQRNPYMRGGFGRYNPNDRGTTKQIKADLSWFLGNHNLKFGISRIDSEYHRTAATSGGGWWVVGNPVTTGDGAHGLQMDKRVFTDDSIVKAQFDAFYAQDSWDVGSGLKVFYGFRYERQQQMDPHGVTFMKFDSFSDYAQPRLGFTWDPENNGRNKISGSFARYFEMIPQRLAARVYGNEVYYRDRWRNTWLDGADQLDHWLYSASGTGTFLTPRTGWTDFAGPYSRDPIAEGTKLPRRTEYTLGYERVLDNGFTVGIHGKLRTMDSIIEDSVIRGANGDPYLAYDDAERAILWNPGHYAAWTDQDGRHHAGWTPFDPARNIYQSIDFTLDKRTDRYYINFSYTWSRLEGNYEGLISSSNGQTDSSITASWDEWPYVGYGLLPLDRTNVIKLLASYNWPLGPGTLTGSVNWVYQSGTPKSLFDDGSTTDGNPPGSGSNLDIEGYGNAIPAHFELGQYGRTPSTNNVDMKLEYAWKVGVKSRLTTSLDILNLFNTRVGTRFLEQATDDNGNVESRYDQATDWQRGRRFRFGIKLNF